jgi:DNA-directed RNA polymerase subunit M/transcription elongation factor TFIIS
MPKIRCRGCETVLSFPDKARGKTVKCPKCSTRLKIPGGDRQAAKTKKKAVTSRDKIEDFGQLDLDSLPMEHHDEQICPYCAAEMEEDDLVCRSCGMNVETGKMDAREQKRRSRKGPDPALFYSRAWTDSWKFLMEEKGIAFRTGLYWTAEEVRERLKPRMVAETERVWQLADSTGVSMRTAAYVHALDRIGEAVHAKGHKEMFDGVPH